MTTEEFSNEFDTLLNSYSTIEAFGKTPSTVELDEYEKSVFLTNAQEEIVIGMYNGKNPFGDSFERTEEIRRYLSDLIKTYTTTDKKVGYTGLSKSSVFFELPDDLWFITYESVNLKDDGLGCMSGEDISVIPITQDEYHRIRKNTFRGTNESTTKKAEIIVGPNDTLTAYNIRYIKRPQAIILSDLEGVTLDNKTTAQECELDPILHQEILQRAVELAKAAYIGDLNSNVELGKRSE